MLGFLKDSVSHLEQNLPKPALVLLAKRKKVVSKESWSEKRNPYGNSRANEVLEVD